MNYFYLNCYFTSLIFKSSLFFIMPLYCNFQTDPRLRRWKRWWGPTSGALQNFAVLPRETLHPTSYGRGKTGVARLLRRCQRHPSTALTSSTEAASASTSARRPALASQTPAGRFCCCKMVSSGVVVRVRL